MLTFESLEEVGSASDIVILSQGKMFKDGHNWKDAYLYVTPFYFPQDFLRLKINLSNKFI
jgi:hypothetical protein